MFNRFYWLLFLVLPVFFTGCLQTETALRINPDGSGQIEEVFVIENDVIEIFRQFASSVDSVQGEEFELFKDDDLRIKAESFGEGVKFERSEKINTDNYQGYKAIYSFKDINKIRINPNPDENLPMGEVENFSERKDLFAFKFKQGNPSVLKIFFPKEQVREQNENREVEIPDSSMGLVMDELSEFFQGIKIRLTLEVNGEIEETDAAYINDNILTLIDIDFTEILKNRDVLEKLARNKLMSMKNFKEMTENIPGIKFEYKDELTVKFH
ncbi:MAG: hypothetical protein HXY49_12200 [Ignavibacteriaceae bacterium]|nr:hypothetical protein [Ignavibacteriaceae bacterium]